jgi:NAD(P)-dependent dehydrogenase (short-subunit alcohol dehydrogenase family)
MQGRVAVVTGASRGIGAAVADELLSLGATVVRISRSTPAPIAGAVDLQADLSDPKARERALEVVMEEHGLPHLVVNNAVSFLSAPIE